MREYPKGVHSVAVQHAQALRAPQFNIPTVQQSNMPTFQHSNMVFLRVLETMHESKSNQSQG
jgi:hypothetical protein